MASWVFTAWDSKASKATITKGQTNIIVFVPQSVIALGQSAFMGLLDGQADAADGSAAGAALPPNINPPPFDPASVLGSTISED